MNTRIKAIINITAVRLGFAAPFPVATVGTIMAQFDRTKSELNRVINEQYSVAEKANDAAWAAREEAVRQDRIQIDAENEAERAGRIHDRLAALLD